MTTMWKKALAAGSIACLCGVFLIVLWQYASTWLLSNRQSLTEETSQNKREAGAIISTTPRSPLFDNYGTEKSTPAEDLKMIARALESYWMLIKDVDSLSVQSNATICHALMGNNSHQIAFLPPDHPQVNPQGELIDRWGTPIMFHALSMTSIELRSAGPDQKPYTNDDVIQKTGGTGELSSYPMRSSSR